MKNAKIVAWGIIISLSLSLFSALFEPSNEDLFYMLSGLGFYVFGIWASIILLKEADK